jgi:hypothetical protein
MNEWIDRLNGRLIAFANDGAFARHTVAASRCGAEAILVEPRGDQRDHGANVCRLLDARAMFVRIIFGGEAPLAPMLRRYSSASAAFFLLHGAVRDPR